MKLADRVWTLKLQPWLQSREDERRRIATEFYAFGIAGIIAGAALFLFVLDRTHDVYIAGLAGGAVGLLGAYMRWEPLQKLQGEIRPRIMHEVASSFGFDYSKRPPKGFSSIPFNETYLVFDSPGRPDDSFTATRHSRSIIAAEANFARPVANAQTVRRRYETPSFDRQLVDFSGLLVRIELKTRPAGKIVLTRERDWFAKWIKDDVNAARDLAQAFDITHPPTGQIFKCIADPVPSAGSICTEGLLTGLIALEAVFCNRPLRLAVLPTGTGGVCYIAAETDGVFDGFSVLEGYRSRGRLQSLVSQTAGLSELTDLVLQELDGVTIDTQTHLASMAEETA